MSAPDARPSVEIGLDRQAGQLMAERDTCCDRRSSTPAAMHASTAASARRRAHRHEPSLGPTRHDRHRIEHGSCAAGPTAPHARAPRDESRSGSRRPALQCLGDEERVAAGAFEEIVAADAALVGERIAPHRATMAPRPSHTVELAVTRSPISQLQRMLAGDLVVAIRHDQQQRKVDDAPARASPADRCWRRRPSGHPRSPAPWPVLPDVGDEVRRAARRDRDRPEMPRPAATSSNGPRPRGVASASQRPMRPAPVSATTATNELTSVDLPMPASPPTNAIRPWPSTAAVEQGVQPGQLGIAFEQRPIATSQTPTPTTFGTRSARRRRARARCGTQSRPIDSRSCSS